MLKRIEVHNYRCFVDFDLAFSERMLLVGYNGAGKSSLFDVLAGLRDLIVSNAQTEDDFPMSALSRLQPTREQQLILELESPWGELRYTLRLSHDQVQGLCTIAHEEVTLEDRPLYRFDQDGCALFSDDHRLLREPFPFTAKRSYLSSLEATEGMKRLEWFRKQLRGLWLVKPNAMVIQGASRSEDSSLDHDAGNFASWYRHLLQSDPARCQQAMVAIQEVIPGFQHLRFEADGRSKVLVASFRGLKGASYELDFDQLSDGQRLLVVLYVLILALPDKVGTLCLDEPDNFVSLREIQPLLVALADLSEDRGVQILLASHSPEVIDYLGPANAVLLERAESGEVTVGKLQAGVGLKLSELLARRWHGEE